MRGWPSRRWRRFVAGELDEHRLADLLAGLLTVDWSGTPDLVLPGPGRSADPALDLLLPFTGTAPIRVPDQGLLRPGSAWPALLHAGRSAEALADAARRLRIAGARQVITPGAARYEGTRLAAALLMHIPHHERLAALRRYPPPVHQRRSPGDLRMSPHMSFDVELAPLLGSTFQPTGFPDIGAATFTRFENGQPVTELLQTLALWEIRRFLASGLRLRTACDLEIVGTERSRHHSTLPALEELTSRIAELMSQSRDFFGEGAPLTVEWSPKKA